MKQTDHERKKAQQLLEQWEENEESMGTEAAYCVACEQLGIDHDYGYELLSLVSK